MRADLGRWSKCAMTTNKRCLIIFLGIGLFAMLAVSLYERFTQPGLTVSRVTRQSAMAGQDNSRIGQLMEEVARDPGNRELILALVEQLMAIGQWQGAENFAQKALALSPANMPDPQALYLLAIIHHNQGKHREAAELLEKLLTKTENPSARYSLGLLYLHFLHEPEAGIAHLEKGLINPALEPALASAMREELAKARNQLLPKTGEAAEQPGE